MSSELSVNGLCVVDFKSKYLTEEMQAWRERNAVPFAASCARQIWYGDTACFADFPYGNVRNMISVLEGPDGYERLLRVMAGLESEREGETHVRGQFADGWRALQSSDPDKAAQFQKLYGQLRMDTTLIQQRILSKHKKRLPEHAARSLSGQVKGDDVLLVAHVTGGGVLANNSERIIRVTENTQKKRDAFLTVTHPDPDVLANMSDLITSLSFERRIRSTISLVSFDEAIDAVLGGTPHYDRLYVDVPMGDYSDADYLLVESWKVRPLRESTLTHLKGTPMARGASTGVWLDPELENYISPEALREEMTERGERNKVILQQAADAASTCAQIRARGELPKNVLADRRPDLMEPGRDLRPDSPLPPEP